jgi:hypothetical protein
MDLKISWLRVFRERMNVVLQDIDYGSEPGGRFYVLTATATLIACLGLITNSTAVIIGALLVAPLMTPIYFFLILSNHLSNCKYQFAITWCER